MATPSPDPRTKASLLWGLVSTFAFLVLLQGYELITTDFASWGVKAVVAVLVGVAGAGATYVAYGWLLGRRTPANGPTENETS